MNFSSAFSSSLSLFPDIKSEFSQPISDEEFKLFHSIDRELYSILVQTLGKLHVVALQILGFWLFLEHEGGKASGLVNTILHWPLNLINGVFNESLLCLRDMHDSSLTIENLDDQELLYLSRLLQESVSTMNFVANRGIILPKVEHEVNIIYRAVKDIPLRREIIPPNFSISNENSSTNVPTRASSIDNPNHGTGVFVPMFLTGEANSSSNVFPFPPQGYHSQVVGDHGIWHFGKSKEKIDYPNEFTSEHYFSMNKNYSEMVEEKQAEEVMAVDRTIFLTFSKGYPLTESELRDFFTRRFGDFIESIEMQGVENGGQPLFAKIVSKSVEMMNVVVEGGKAKYYINRKHVCARKFILV